MGSSDIIAILPEDMTTLLAYPHPNYDYAMTNDGIRITLPCEVDHRTSAYIAFLSCRVGPDGGVVAIFLDRTYRQQYTRISPYELLEFPTSYTAGLRKQEDMYIKQRPSKIRKRRATPSPSERVIMYLEAGDYDTTPKDEDESQGQELVTYNVQEACLQEAGFTVTDCAPESHWSAVQTKSEASSFSKRLTVRHPLNFASHLAGCIVYATPDVQDRLLVALGFRMSERIGHELQLFPWVQLFDITDHPEHFTAAFIFDQWLEKTHDNVGDPGQPFSAFSNASFTEFMSEVLKPGAEEASSAATPEISSNAWLNYDFEPTCSVVALPSGPRVTANVLGTLPVDRTDVESPQNFAFEVRILV